MQTINSPIITARGMFNGPLGLTRAAVNWSPLSLPNLLNWHDASDAATITLVGAKVSVWGDKSGNGNNAVQANDALRPTLSAANLNGLNVIDYPTGGQNMTLNTRRTNVRSVFILARYRVQTGGQFTIMGDSIEYPFFTGDRPGLLYAGISSPATVVNGSKYVNGVLTAGDLVKELAWTQYGFLTTGNTSIDRFTQDRGFTGRSINGWIAEIIMMSSVATTEDLTSLQNYWATKYAL